MYPIAQMTRHILASINWPVIIPMDVGVAVLINGATPNKIRTQHSLANSYLFVMLLLVPQVYFRPNWCAVKIAENTLSAVTGNGML